MNTAHALFPTTVLPSHQAHYKPSYQPQLDIIPTTYLPYITPSIVSAVTSITTCYHTNHNCLQTNLTHNLRGGLESPLFKIQPSKVSFPGRQMGYSLCIRRPIYGKRLLLTISGQNVLIYYIQTYVFLKYRVFQQLFSSY